MTFDFRDNERRMSLHLTARAEAIAQAMRPSALSASPRSGHDSIVPYQTTHSTGGAIMGADPATSAVNAYLQSWDVPNVFAFGASALPQNAGRNPTGTIGALTYRALDAIKSRYLQEPGPFGG